MVIKLTEEGNSKRNGKSRYMRRMMTTIGKRKKRTSMRGGKKFKGREEIRGPGEGNEEEKEMEKETVEVEEGKKKKE